MRKETVLCVRRLCGSGGIAAESGHILKGALSSAQGNAAAAGVGAEGGC